MVGPEDLANAVGLNSSLGTTARVVGPAIGGAIVALAGAGVAFAVNSVTLPRRGRRPAPDRRVEAAPAAQGPRRDAVVGGALDALRFVVHNTRAGVAFFAVLVLSTFAFNLNVLFPLVADADARRRPRRRSAWSPRCFGAGALVGALATAETRDEQPRYLLGGAFLYGVLELILAPQTSVTAVCVILVADGALLHPVGHDGADRDPARGAGAPARARGEPLLLGVPRRSADRRPLRRLARLGRRHRARVRRRGHDRRDDRRRGHGSAAPRRATARSRARWRRRGRGGPDRGSAHLDVSRVDETARARRGSTAVREGASVSVLRRVGTRTFASVRKYRNFRLYFCGPGRVIHGLLDAADRGRVAAAAADRLGRRGRRARPGDAAATTLLGLFVGTVIDRSTCGGRRSVRGSFGRARAAFAVLTLGGWITVGRSTRCRDRRRRRGADGPARHALSSRWSDRRTYRTRWR